MQVLVFKNKKITRPTTMAFPVDLILEEEQSSDLGLQEMFSSCQECYDDCHPTALRACSYGINNKSCA